MDGGGGDLLVTVDCVRTAMMATSADERSTTRDFHHSNATGLSIEAGGIALNPDGVFFELGIGNVVLFTCSLGMQLT